MKKVTSFFMSLLILFSLSVPVLANSNNDLSEQIKHEIITQLVNDYNVNPDEINVIVYKATQQLYGVGDSYYAEAFVFKASPTPNIWPDSTMNISKTVNTGKSIDYCSGVLSLETAAFAYDANNGNYPYTYRAFYTGYVKCHISAIQ